MDHTNRVTGTGDTNSLQNTTVSQLLSQALSCQHLRSRSVIGLQTTNVVRVRLLNTTHEASKLILELLADGFLL